MNLTQYGEYFHYLQRITWLGRIYKRYISSPILYRCSRTFGKRILEVGSGIGSGVLGASFEGGRIGDQPL